MISRIEDAYGALQGDDASASGVSWGAILAGAFAAGALSFILIMLGFGLGFSAISPWTGGADAQTIGVSTILWLAFTQIAASAIGGYMSGRLRVKWASVHTDEVYFRDTAHGFLAWAVASLATAALLTSAIGGVLAGGAKVAGTTAAIASATGIQAGMGGSASGYFIDALFRPAPNPGAATPPADASMSSPGNVAPDAAQRAEVARIFAYALRRGSLSDADKTYLAQVLAKRNGMSQADAEKRVNDIYIAYSKAVAQAENNAKAAAQKASKAAAYSALWMFIALLCGAFVASLCATFGGRMRDRVILVNTVSSAS